MHISLKERINCSAERIESILIRSWLVQCRIFLPVSSIDLLSLSAYLSNTKKKYKHLHRALLEC